MTPLDPALGLVLSCGLALLFLRACAHKLRDPSAFRGALRGYRLLPERWLAPLAAAVIALEAAAGVGALLPATRTAAVGGMALLLALYAGAIAANLARGRRDIDCGCAGPAARQPLSAGLVVRNLGLLVAALACLAPAAPRPLHWLDAGTVALGVAALALLYAAVDGLIANAARLAGEGA